MPDLLVGIIQVHARSAKLLLRLFQFNKGIFIKFGQHLCALEYILPEEYTQTMTVLQARAPSRPFKDIEKGMVQLRATYALDCCSRWLRAVVAVVPCSVSSRVRRDARGALLKVQSCANRCRVSSTRYAPRCCRSIIECTRVSSPWAFKVHVAELHGEKFAVKVQFPGLRETCQGDTWTISILVKAVAWVPYCSHVSRPCTAMPHQY